MRDTVIGVMAKNSKLPWIGLSDLGILETLPNKKAGILKDSTVTFLCVFHIESDDSFLLIVGYPHMPAQSALVDQFEMGVAA